jgi:hypothetical protein
VNEISGLNIVVQANGTLTLHSRWCSGNPTEHTARSSFTGTDANRKDGDCHRPDRSVDETLARRDRKLLQRRRQRARTQEPRAHAITNLWPPLNATLLRHELEDAAHRAIRQEIERAIGPLADVAYALALRLQILKQPAPRP